MDVVTKPSSSKLSERLTSKRATIEHSTASPLSRVWYGLAVAVGVIAVVSVVLYLTLALQWRGRGFLGVMVSKTLVVDGSQPLSSEVWAGLKVGLTRLDRIVAIDGWPLADDPQDGAAALAKFHAITANLKPGDQIQVEFTRAPVDGMVRCVGVTGSIGDCRVRLVATAFPDVDLIGFFFAPFVTGVLTLFIGWFVLFLRPNQAAARLVSLICFLTAVFLAGFFDINTTHTLIPLWIVVTVALGASLVALGLVFPARALILYRMPMALVLPFLAATAAAVVLLWLHFDPPMPEFQTGQATFVIVLVGIVFLVARLWINRRSAISFAARDQSTTMLIGLVLTAAPISIWLINMIAQIANGTALVPFNTSAGTPFALVAPLSMAYAVLQYRFVDTDRMISQGITYGIMMVALISGYFLLVFSASLLLTQGLVQANSPMLIAIAIFVIAAFFLPVRSFLQGRIDRLYHRERINYQHHLEAFTHDVTSLSDLNAIIDLFKSRLNQSIAPGSLFVFLINRQSNAYVAAPGAETEIQFSLDSGIVSGLKENANLVYLDPARPWPVVLQSERSRLTILNTLAIAGLQGSRQLEGFICVGAPRSGSGIYRYEELLYLQNLAIQLAIAVERTQVIKSLERRVQELNVLTNVSQGVNFTIDFDDLLELISAQTSKLIDARNFYIALRDEVSNELYFAFFLEGDERYREVENKRWPMGGDLFSEVARTGQPMRVVNYAAMMAQRNSPIADAGANLKAWMGVPLLAGMRTLGVMAVGTTLSGKTYGDDQFKFFNDIGALAATSIDKARLFEETNRRARQLSALNTISSQLAGELDIARLLELVTRSAVDILNAEAGSLLLVVDDNNTRELEFKVAIGKIGQEFVGQRFPVKRGLAGEVASKGKWIIVNNAATDARWGGELAAGSFITHAVLAVPLIAKGETVGVLEAINREDGGIYTEDDANLLMTFASQAAIAIENARLFQMTDLQLSARVDELEALERIDVELNRSLDLQKVAEITMRWAIASSGATSGVLGLITGDDPPQLRVIARYGYDERDFPEGTDSGLWPLNRGIVGRVMRTRQADLAPDVSIDPNYAPSLRGSLSQITVPMMSGGEITGMVILETNKMPRLNLIDLSFVQRLAEHASIALTNAQLYAELERANDSKSEFVSFVAHELRTPMTSIKGYADLMLGGHVGQLSDQQQTFLTTIRSNIERMNTLVSDLNDVTKLQTDNLRMEMSPVDFSRVVTETLRPLQKQIEDKQQTLSVILPPDLPPIMGDQNRLIQVLTNLVSNAYKYTPEGGDIRIHTEVTPNRWDHKAKNPDMMLHIMVEDSGIGMSADDLKRLSTPYFRSDNPAARQQPGTGLGLTITYGIVERHNGQIWVESEVGQGTTFHFIIPLANEVAPQPSK